MTYNEHCDSLSVRKTTIMDSLSVRKSTIMDSRDTAKACFDMSIACL